jgi:flagellar hook-basal body complex protein FliE
MSEPIQRSEIDVRRVNPAQLDPGQLRTRATGPSTGESPSFKDVLTDTIGEVQRLQTEADESIKRYVAGEVTDVTEAVLAVQKADVAFQSMMQVRNRIVAAYEEIMRMQV